MKELKIEILEFLKEESQFFTKKQIKNISLILKLISENLSGKHGSCSSGGGFYHMYFQTKDKRWIWFHSGTGDITISEPFNTAEQVYEALWDANEKVCSLVPKHHICYGEGEFNQVKTIAKDIINKDFKDIME